MKGVSQDYGMAKEWYLKAAEQNHAHAQYMIGWIYEHNLGVSKDYEKAKEWYLKAAALGHIPAQNSLMRL